ncbi:WYL domain-containing protein [Marinobacter pelagius]|uniref:WYL domain-containing protein n=1 Tax=Marinobacter pelagius TaxID=379482 RepID=A0A1I4T5K0_9GAMM|nr:WYL domain-containing protein [Marinobacter pelagius]SFM71893.1 hypothetical protein SAMN04487961_1009 [Marinobacter pelagius]
MDISEVLQEAAQNGEVLTIAYHGGSQPGAKRQIAPIKVKDDKLRARCFSSESVKVFRIDKIEILEGDAAESYTAPTPSPKFKDIEDLVAHHLENFKKKGWTVDVSEESLLLFDHFKNGKPRKTPALSLFYEKYTSELYWDGEEDSDFACVEREKPWSVSARRKIFSAFKHFHKAADRFLTLESQSSPHPKE